MKKHVLTILMFWLLSGSLIAQNVQNQGFSFTDEVLTYTQNFNEYLGTSVTLPPFMFVSWDEDRTDNPFTGEGDFNSSDPENSYGGFTAFTSAAETRSFGIREREPVDLRDARLFFSFTNNTSDPISEFEISYDVEAWFIGDRRNRIRLKYDTLLESDDRDTFEEDIFSTDNPSGAAEIGKVNGALDNNRITITGLVDITTIDKGNGEFFEPLAPGETAYFRWQKSNADGDGGSLRSGLAINNISISVPAPTSIHPPASVDAPQQVKLFQNYPNPFNPSTSIGFSLGQSESVLLTVYNLQGQHLATLVDGNLPAGTHNIMFDATGLASGIYIYRIQAGTTVTNKLMTLVK